jgi:putative flavoprotein involved in K+ transport
MTQHVEHIETIIVGGGQAGLSTSYYLAQAGREHLVLEQSARPANAWRNDRWDSFTLVTPNWTFRLPGAEYQDADPGGYMPLGEIVARFERYVDQFKLPVRYNTCVVSVEPVEGGGYRVQTDAGDGRLLHANNVVIATGFFQRPKVPAFGANLPPGLLQLHSGQYRKPESLPPGGVLVVGSGQSGCQIAEELYQAGRPVYLCTGGAGRLPRRYRGRDIVDWLVLIGFFDRTLDMLSSPQERYFAPPHTTGKNGGHTINLHQFARDGVTLLGHLVGAADGRIALAPDLPQNLSRADGFEVEMLKQIDGYIARNGLDVPGEQVPRLRDGYAAPVIEELDLRQAGIGSIVWAAGYRFDYSLVRLPVLDGLGWPLTDRGATNYPGLYLVGLPWQPGLRSAFLFGVRENAAHVVAHIVDRDA